MPTRVFLLRHAETANPHVFHGAESDVGLSERGRLQAEAVARVLAPERPDTVVCSGMRRALDTATPIARACGLELRVEPLLHERRVGALAGQVVEVTRGEWAEVVGRWRGGETGYAPPGSESYDDMVARVLPVWRRVTEEHAGRRIVVVGHGMVCRVLLLTVLAGHSLADWDRVGFLRNVGVSELLRAEVGGPWTAVRLNEVPEKCG